jgi:hypothetical protein
VAVATGAEVGTAVAVATGADVPQADKTNNITKERANNFFMIFSLLFFRIFDLIHVLFLNMGSSVTPLLAARSLQSRTIFFISKCIFQMAIIAINCKLIITRVLKKKWLIDRNQEV